MKRSFIPRRRVAPAAMALALLPLAVVAPAGPAQADENALQVFTTGTSTSSDGPFPIATQAAGKAFRAAPQNNQNRLTVAFSCELAATGPALRSLIDICQITTDTGVVANFPTASVPGPAATSTGTVVLSGNRVTKICMQGRTRFADQSLQITDMNCQSIIAVVI